MVIPLRLLLVAAVLPVSALTVPTVQAVENIQTLESVHVDNTPRVVTPRVVNGREPGTGEVGSLVYVQAGGTACSLSGRTARCQAPAPRMCRIDRDNAPET